MKRSATSATSDASWIQICVDMNWAASSRAASRTHDTLTLAREHAAALERLHLSVSGYAGCRRPDEPGAHQGEVSCREKTSHAAGGAGRGSHDHRRTCGRDYGWRAGRKPAPGGRPDRHG